MRRARAVPEGWHQKSIIRLALPVRALDVFRAVLEMTASSPDETREQRVRYCFGPVNWSGVVRALSDAMRIMIAQTRRTLHEAMRLVLDENGGSWMLVHELAKAIYERELCCRKDQGVIPPGQIRVRAASIRTCSRAQRTAPTTCGCANLRLSKRQVHAPGSSTVARTLSACCSRSDSVPQCRWDIADRP
jgi:hypothetical protein